MEMVLNVKLKYKLQIKENVNDSMFFTKPIIPKMI